MALNRFALAFLACMLPGLAFAATPPALQEASQLMKQGHAAQALDKLNTYLASNTKDPQARFLKGLALAELNRTPEAIKTFNDLTDDYPELPEPYNNLAVLYASQGQYEQAKNSLEKAIRTNPTYATAHENLGDIYAKMASQAYDKALQLDKTNSSAQTKLALVRDIFTPTGLDRNKAAKPAPVKTASAAPDMPAQPAQAKPTTQPAPAAPSQPAGPVEKAIRDWASEWSQRDVAGYLAAYSPNFMPPNGMSRSDWENQRKQRLTAPSYIRVDVSDFDIQQDGNQATARFREHYESNLLNVNVSKKLVLEQISGSWKIVSEQ